jgi:cytochrome c oxidase cbb3-type subunit III
MSTWKVACLVALLVAGCQRETRELRLDPPVADALDRIAVMPNNIGGAPPDVYAALGEPYRSNAYNLNEGKRLYSWFNCKGCHADGGGATGPALFDGWWRYGADDVSVLASLRDGRPNGMPAYGDKLTTEQLWQLTGYVQSLGANSASTAATSRNDEMHARPSENRAPAAAGLGTAPSR